MLPLLTDKAVELGFCESLSHTGDDLYAGMRFKPRAQCFGFPIREEINRAAALQIDEQCAVSPTSSERKVIYSDDARRSCLYLR